MGRVAIICEFSGVVRDAFLRRGHFAVSVDLLPSESDFGIHIIGDARPFLAMPWDLVIAHPPCTTLCNSGVRWLHERPERWPQMFEAAEFFRECLNANAPRVAVENPVMHGYGVERVGRKQDFSVQPWQFGDGETKRTCFWTRNLPPLESTNVVDGREGRVFRAPPKEDRWKGRSRFPLGMADAMAEQWGKLI